MELHDLQMPLEKDVAVIAILSLALAVAAIGCYCLQCPQICCCVWSATQRAQCSVKYRVEPSYCCCLRTYSQIDSRPIHSSLRHFPLTLRLHSELDVARSEAFEK
jgi:hypothetical protein